MMSDMEWRAVVVIAMSMIVGVMFRFRMRQ